MYTGSKIRRVLTVLRPHINMIYISTLNNTVLYCCRWAGGTLMTVTALHDYQRLFLPSRMGL